LLGGDPVVVAAYPIELVLAEKIVTAIQRGTANTRWRDFVDIANLADREFDAAVLTESIQRVALHREAPIRPLVDVLDGYSEIAQSRWTAWRRKQQLHATPESFAELLATVTHFTDSHLPTSDGQP